MYYAILGLLIQKDLVINFYGIITPEHCLVFIDSFTKINWLITTSTIIGDNFHSLETYGTVRIIIIRFQLFFCIGSS